MATTNLAKFLQFSGRLSSLVNSRKVSAKLLDRSFARHYSATAYTTRYADYDHVKVSAPCDHVLHVQLSRPEKRNSIHREMFREISSCFNEISSDKQCRAVVISGEGKMFCSGLDYMDTADMMGGLISGNENERNDIAAKAKFLRDVTIMMQNSFSSIVKCPKPVISAIHSGCIGAGLDLITATDIRYASKDAYFSVREVVLGIIADLGTLQRLPKIVGNDSIVRELAFTGRDLFPDEAKEIGLVGNVFDSFDTCLQEALDLAKLISSKSPVAVQGTKQALNYSRDHTEQEGLEYMQIVNMCQLQSEDVGLAVQALITKENATFQNL